MTHVSDAHLSQNLSRGIVQYHPALTRHLCERERHQQGMFNKQNVFFVTNVVKLFSKLYV